MVPAMKASFLRNGQVVKGGNNVCLIDPAVLGQYLSQGEKG